MRAVLIDNHFWKILNFFPSIFSFVDNLDTLIKRKKSLKVQKNILLAILGGFEDRNWPKIIRKKGFLSACKNMA